MSRHDGTEPDRDRTDADRAALVLAAGISRGSPEATATAAALLAAGTLTHTSQPSRRAGAVWHVKMAGDGTPQEQARRIVRALEQHVQGGPATPPPEPARVTGWADSWPLLFAAVVVALLAVLVLVMWL